MFENKTFESILGAMLKYVGDNYPELDTRVGSVIYTALAPIALEIETAYHDMEMVADETFLDTASKEFLIRHGDQIGLEINRATYGHYKGEFDVDVEIGSRFNLDKFNYAVLGKLADPTVENPCYVFELVCETSGSEPNSYLGDLTPISYVPSLGYGKLTEVLTYGEDEEDTEVYRYRLQTHVKTPPNNGNVYQYNEWLDGCDGVGKYRTLPCWNGINTVKLLILDVESRRASEKLITDTQNYFDPPTAEIDDDPNSDTYPQGRGMGNGVAPIGAIVTVGTVSETPVAVNCVLTLKEGYTTPVGVADAVDNYLKSIALTKSTVAYMPISAAIYNAESVAEVNSLSIKVGTTTMDASKSPFVPSVNLASDSIAVLDTTNSVWGVG